MQDNSKRILPKLAYVTLTLKMLIITVIIGVIVWLVLDKVQTEYLNKYFLTELDKRLHDKARVDKFLFNKYVTLFKYTSRQITSLKNFTDYIQSDPWSKSSPQEIKEYKRLPPWFPKRSVMRSLAVPKIAFLLDENGRVREQYLAKDITLPKTLRDPSMHLVQVTHAQGYITMIEGFPYLLSSERILSPEGKSIGYMLLASPVDSRLLERSQQSVVSSNIVVLLSTEEPFRVIASSRQDIVPVGTDIEDLQKSYRITDIEFIEYGGSDFRVKFVSLLPYTEVKKLTDNINDKIRVNILVTSIIFVFVFSLLIFYITRKIKELTNYVTDFELEELKRRPEDIHYLDELYVLRYRFDNLIKEVIESRNELKKESAELKTINEELDKANADLQISVKEYEKAKKEKEHIWNQLLQSQKMESIGRLTGGVAHDFNNLLGGIIGFAQLIKGLKIDNDDLKNFIEIIIQGGKKASNLIHQLLAFSRKQALDMDVVNINRLIENLSKMLVRVIGEDIKLKLDLYRKNLPVNIDSTQFEQVLMNLAVNARHAMPHGGTLTIETSEEIIKEGLVIDLDEATPGNYVTMTISDTGNGIPEEIQEKIFEPFFTTKEKGEGSGLGLSTVFGIVKQHGGFIKLNSKEGEGAAFKIYLHKAEGIEAEYIAKEDESLKEGDETILLADDEKIILQFLTKTLSNLGYNVIPATSGEEAFELFNNSDQKIDLLITDVIMTGLNGFELYKKIRSKDPEIKVIFISGYIDNPILSDNIQKDNHVLINKPVHLKFFTDIIRKMLDEK